MNDSNRLVPSVTVATAKTIQLAGKAAELTEQGVYEMRKAFNLTRSYPDPLTSSGKGGAVMPPPPRRGEGPCPLSRIELFARWKADGCQP